MNVKNYLNLNKFSFRYNYYAFVDTTEYLADAIFAKNKLTVRFMNKEMRKPDTDYVVVFCKVKKKDAHIFRASMGELEQKMVLMGYSDYSDFSITSFADILGL